MKRTTLFALLPILGLALALGALLIGLPRAVGAQSPEPSFFEIPLKSGKIVLENGKFDVFSHRYVVVQLTRNLRLAEIESLRDHGVNLLSFLYRRAWIAAVEPDALTPALIDQYAIAAAVPWRSENKASVELSQGKAPEWALTADGSIKLLVTFFEDVTRKEIEGLLSRHASHYEILSGPDVWVVQIAPNRIDALTQEPIVHYAEEGPRPKEPLLDFSRSLVHAGAVQDVDLTGALPVYNGLSGRGVNIAVVDDGYIATYHHDFWEHDSSGYTATLRVINCRSTPCPGVGDHATYVAGIVGGNGWQSDKDNNGGTPFQWRGMTPEVSFISSRLWDANFGYTDRSDIHTSNHSYVEDYGEYNSESAGVDEDIRGGNGLARQRPHVWAAGNNGVSSAHGPKEGYYAVTGIQAKNAIVVGAVNTNDSSLAHFSSLGPTFDGRIKPDVMAGGSSDLLYTLDIDYIRIFDGSDPTPVRQWEFNTAGNLEGWFSLEKWLIYDEQVSDGLLSLQTRDGGYGFVENVNLAAQDSHIIKMRYRIESQTNLPQAGSRFYWKRAGSPEHIDGWMDYEAPLDGQFHVVSVPVGQDIRWQGTIARIRIDPVLLGKRILSTSDTGGYVAGAGTSGAAPAVAGVVGLMLQQFVEKHGVDLDVNPPFPSTIKAILIHTATDLVHDEADSDDLCVVYGYHCNPDTG